MLGGERLWRADPQREQHSKMAAFLSFANNKTSRALRNWQELYAWSITELDEFWGCLAEFCQVLWTVPASSVYRNPQQRIFTAQWFSEGRLNFAENLLLPAGDAPVLTAIYEGGFQEQLSGTELRRRVLLRRASLREWGVGQGDFVAGVLPNGSEAIVLMLAAASLGAVWGAVSPDFGVAAILDRLLQIDPKVVFFSQGYRYNGVYYSCREKLISCREGLAGKSRGVCVPYPGGDEAPPRNWLSFESFLELGQKQADLNETSPFVPLPFNHPLYVLFTSGTTGKPKGIIHGAGGTLLQHKKELLLHCDIGPGDRMLFYTTCGWMMWNWMVSALSVGCQVVTYDGSPAYPGSRLLWQLAEAQRLTVLGTSPKYLGICRQAEISPGSWGDFSSLRTVLSTGAPLLPEHYHWVYTQVKADLHLASISGGTDIISCFMLGNPLLPVHAGEIQGPGLGMAIAARSLVSPKRLVGQKGELICTQPFVAMPVAMLGDDKQRSRYQRTYFKHFSDEEVWRHGDFVEITSRGSIIVYGRSDAVLNPGGVRIGTAELYQQLAAMREVDDAVAVGYPQGDDTIIVLLVKLSAGLTLDSSLQQRIKKHLRNQLSPRHVPRKIIQVSKIPYTRNGKKMEVAVLQALLHQPIDNVMAMEDPSQIAEYSSLVLN